MPVLLLLFAVLLLPQRPLSAQWRLAISAGTAATSGHARDAADPEQAAILPDHPVSWLLALARQRGSWRVGIDGSRITSDLAIRGSSTSLVTRGALSAWGLGFEASRRLAGHAAAPSLWAGVGAVYERWSFDIAGGDARWRASGRASLQLDAPLSRRWSALVRGEALAGASLFRVEELPEGYTRRASQRAGLLLGVSRRW